MISGALVFVLLLSAATPGTGTGKFFPAFGPFPKLLLLPDPMSVCLSVSLPLSLTRTHRGTNAVIFFYGIPNPSRSTSSSKKSFRISASKGVDLAPGPLAGHHFSIENTLWNS